MSALKLSLKTHLVTTAQSGFFWAAKNNPFCAAHTEQLSLELDGCLEFPNVERALQRIVAIQPVLRTSFETEGGLVLAREHPDLPFLPLEERDLTTLSESAQSEFLEGDEDLKRHRLFDLGQAPLFLISLYRRSADRFRISFTFHHMITDGWSLCAVGNELLDKSLSPQRGNATDQADEILQTVQSTTPFPIVRTPSGRRQELAPALPLPYDGLKETIPIYGFYRVALGDKETTKILERDQVLSSSGKWLQWTAQWLSALTGFKEVSFTTAVSTRMVKEGEAQNYSIPLGCYVSPQVIRSTVNPEDIREEIQRVIRHARSGMPEGVSGNHQVISVFEKMPMEYCKQGLSLRDLSLRNTAGFDISIQGWIFKGRLQIGWNYRRDRFSSETIRRLAGLFLSVKGVS